MESKKFLSLKDVAEKLQVHYATVYREVKKGRLAAFKFGRDFRISEDELSSYISRNKVN